jgi:hypothetical protein
MPANIKILRARALYDSQAVAKVLRAAVGLNVRHQSPRLSRRGCDMRPMRLTAQQGRALQLSHRDWRHANGSRRQRFPITGGDNARQ